MIFLKIFKSPLPTPRFQRAAGRHSFVIISTVNLNFLVLFVLWVRVPAGQAVFSLGSPHCPQANATRAKRQIIVLMFSDRKFS